MAKSTTPTKTLKTKSASKSAVSRKSSPGTQRGDAKQDSEAKDHATAANRTPSPCDQENRPSEPNQILEVPGTGKLGKVATAVAQREGATMLELADATGWQAHTIRAALSRLRKRGMPIILADRDGRKAYRVA